MENIQQDDVITYVLPFSLLSFMLQYRINVGQSHVEERKVGTQPKGRQKKVARAIRRNGL